MAKPAKFEIDTAKAGINNVSKVVSDWDAGTWIKILAYVLLFCLVLSTALLEQTKQGKLKELRMELHEFEKTTKHILGNKLSPKYHGLHDDAKKFSKDMYADYEKAIVRLDDIVKPEATGVEYVKKMNAEINRMVNEKNCVETKKNDKGEYVCWKNADTSCYAGQDTYYGFSNRTASNNTCLAWNTIKPAGSPELYKNFKHNFCRFFFSSTIDKIPWCYVNSPALSPVEEACFEPCTPKKP